jgi:Tfp pilus assembly protein PilX
MRQKRERGSILVVTLLVLGALTVLGLATITLSGMDGEVAVNQRGGDQAFYVAEAGLYAGVAAVAADSSLADDSPLTTITTSYINDGSADQYFPGSVGAAQMNVQVGVAPPPGGGVQCGLVGYSDKFGTLQFQVVSTGIGPGPTGAQATRQVQAIMALPPLEGLCPPGDNVKGGYIGG